VQLELASVRSGEASGEVIREGWDAESRDRTWSVVEVTRKTTVRGAYDNLKSYPVFTW